MKVRNLVRFSAGAAFLLVGMLTLASPPPAGLGYHLIKTIPMPKTPRETFDYLTVDSAGRRVYVSHGSEVEVVDMDSGAVLGTVGGLKGCHGIALDKELGKGYITDGTAASIVVFDLATFKVTGMVKGEPDADAALFDPASKLIFAFNGDSKSATVIDPTKDTVVKRIDLKGGPEFPASDGMGMVYDNNNETNEVMQIDTKTLEIKARWSAKPAGGLTAMAIDGPHRRIFSAGRNPQMLIMMDADNGKVIQSFPIGSGVDAVAFSSRRLVWCLRPRAKAKYASSTRIRRTSSASLTCWTPRTAARRWASTLRRTTSM